MQEMKLSKAWEIVYPVGIYYVINNIAFFLIGLAVPYSNENYGFMKVLATLLTFPFIYRIYRMDERRRGTGDAGFSQVWADFWKELPVILGIAVMGVCAAVVLNDLIAWTPLVGTSKTYREVSEAFYGGRIVFEILGPCILIPILEEYVFRGLVYKRLREWLNFPAAAVVSAVIFGMMHMNVVQFVYAGILGIFMALCVERTKHLYGAVTAHIAANAISVLRTETDWFDGMGVLATIGLALIFLGLFIVFFGKIFHTGKNDPII